MILLDSDVLIIDLQYPNDPKFPDNRKALQQMRAANLVVGMTSQAFLEVIGKLSFNTASARVAHLPQYLTASYQLVILPDPHQHPAYAGCTVPDLIAQMSHQMALGDAVQAVQIARFASFADCLLTWNAKHFVGKLVIPVLTPLEWLHQQAAGTP